MPVTELGFVQLLNDRRHREKWCLTGPMCQGTDTTIKVGDIAIAAHSTVLAAKAPRLCNWGPQKAKKREINLDGADIHTVWRTLELIYCQTYTSSCPKTNVPGKYVHWNHSTVC
jgi:hypothetical protein